MGIININLYIGKVICHDANHVIRSAEAGAHGHMQNAGTSFFLQLTIKCRNILRKRQRGLGQFGLQYLIKLILTDFLPIPKLSLAGCHTKGDEANVILRQLLITKVTGRICHQCNTVIADGKHKNPPILPPPKRQNGTV